MANRITPPYKSLKSRQFKDTNKSQKQLSIVKAAFYPYPSTMLMVSHLTGIERASICRYVATLRKSGAIKLVRFGKCSLTGFRAGFYTTNLRGGWNG